MSSAERDEERRKDSDDRKRQEEYNTRRRFELGEKYKGSSYLGSDKARKECEQKDVVERLRGERLAIKEQRKRQSIDSKMPQFTVRRKPVANDSPREDSWVESPRRTSITDDPTIYFPHQGVRRSIFEDITTGGSRRATEPLKAQLMEIISNMSQTSKFKAERIHTNIVASLIPKPKGTTVQDRGMESPQVRSGVFSSTPGTHSPRRLSPAQYRSLNAQYNYDEGVEDTLGTTPHIGTTDRVRLQVKATQIQTVPQVSTSPHHYHVDDSTDVSTSVANTADTHQLNSHQSTSNATNTIRLPSNSSEMKAGRTAEFLNEGWYHNVYYNDTNDDFSSVLASSARQMNVPTQQMQDMQNIPNIQHMAASGQILCDQCRYSSEQMAQHSQPCCSGLAQNMAPMESYSQQGPRRTTANQCDEMFPKRNSILRTVISAIKNPLTRLGTRGRHFDPATSELYRLNITEGNNCQGCPKRVIFDLINGEMCRPPVATVGTNTQVGIGHSPLIAQMGIVQPGGSNKLLFNPHPQKSACPDQQNSYNIGEVIVNQPQGDQPPSNISKMCLLKHNLRRHQQRIDVYYFDHGNASYYRTTDSPGTIYTELIAERTEHHSAQYWAELFGTIHIAFSLFTAFFLQLYRFILQSTFRPIIVGFVQLSSDYMIKPLLALIFNALIQPLLIYLYNIATSFRDLCEPIADALGFFLREVAVPIRAFRLVEMKHHRNTRPCQVL